MNTRHKHADVIIAWAEGKDVQVWDKLNCRWADVDNDAVYFMAEYKYRIKPPAKKYRVALFRRHNDEPLAVASNEPVTAANYESMPDFVRWLTDWIEYEE